jgi:hypothetical protein
MRGFAVSRDPQSVRTTVRRNFPEEHCHDCGKKGCTVEHSGPYVPRGTTGRFDEECWKKRMEYRTDTKEPMPYGWRKIDLLPERPRYGDSKD